MDNLIQEITEALRSIVAKIEADSKEYTDSKLSGLYESIDNLQEQINKLSTSDPVDPVDPINPVSMQGTIVSKGSLKAGEQGFFELIIQNFESYDIESVVFDVAGQKNTEKNHRYESWPTIPGLDFQVKATVTLSNGDTFDFSADFDPIVEEPVVPGSETLIFHFDGNNNDEDDIAAMPVAAMLLAGDVDDIHFFYNNNYEEPNEDWQVTGMRSSAAFAEKFGIKTYDYTTGKDAVRAELVKLLTSGKRIVSLEGGPMTAIYDALSDTPVEYHSRIKLVSHHPWNENRDSDKRWRDIESNFPDVKLVEIPDQNPGFLSSQWSWLESDADPVFNEARRLMKYAARFDRTKMNDASDAGMAFWYLTGNREGRVSDAKSYLKQKDMAILISTQPEDKTPPSQVVNVTLVSKDASSITIRWDDATDNLAVAGYEISINSANAIDAGDTLNYSSTGLSGQTQYSFRVRAYDSALNKGAWSETFTVTTDPGAIQSTEVLMLYGDVSSNGAIPSGGASPYHQMRLNDTGTEGFSDFSDAINALPGVSISEMYDVDFDPAVDLSGVKVLFLASSQRNWSAGEITTIDTWVRNGGSLIAFSDSALGGAFFNVGAQNTVGQTVRNELFENYGMQFHVDQAEGVRNHTLPSGSVFGNTSSLSWRTEGSSPIRIDASAGDSEGNPVSVVAFSGSPSHTQNVTYTGDISALAVATPGNGLVIALSDRNLIWNGGAGTDIGEVDNQEFLETLFSYSASYTNSSGLSFNQTTRDFVFTTENGNSYPVVDFTYAGVPGGIPDTSGATVTTVQSGTGDDRQAILDAISLAVSSRANDQETVVVYIPDGTWNLSNGINITDDRVVIKGQSRYGTILEYATSSNQSGFRFLGSWTTSGRKTINVDHDRNTMTLNLPSGHGFSQGQYFHVELDGVPAYFENKFKPWPYSGEFDGEFYRNLLRIETLNGNTATVHVPIRVAIDASEQDFEMNPATVVFRSGVENLTMRWPSQISNSTAKGVEFAGAAECWVKDIDLLRPPSSIFWGSRPGGTQCTMQGTYSTEPHNTGGGGNGYAGFLGMHDSLMDNCTFDDPRHGPNMQGYIGGDVIRRCTFNNTNGEMHADFAGYFLIEQTTMFKGTKGNHDVWQSKFIHNQTDGHDPTSGRYCFWNNFLNGENGGGGGIRCGGLDIYTLFGYNKVVSDGTGGWIRQANSLEIFDFCEGLAFVGNNFQSIAQTDAVRFVPGFDDSSNPGFGQTGLGNWNKFPSSGTNERYAEPDPGDSLPINQTASVHFEDNTFYGVTPGEEWTGYNTPATDVGNTFNTGQPSGSLEDTTPPFASMYEAQVSYREDNPSIWND